MNNVIRFPVERTRMPNSVKVLTVLWLCNLISTQAWQTAKEVMQCKAY